MRSILLVVALAGDPGAEAAPIPDEAGVTLDDAEQEAFLREAEAVARRSAPVGAP